MYGYWGKSLEVDLTTQTVREKDLPEDILYKFLGGRGLGVYLYTQYTPNLNVGPLSAENPIILATGPLTGTQTPTAGRATMTMRSPLTGTIFTGNAGGIFGALMKFTGYDAIIITGSANRPVYLYISDEGVEINSAEELWGKSTKEVTKLLKDRYTRASAVLTIGIGGENGVLFSSILVDGERGFGRGGVGAVWGAKKLKAVVVKGKRKVTVADQQRFKSVLYEANKSIKQSPLTSKALPSMGTSYTMDIAYNAGALPIRNFSQTVFEGLEKVDSKGLKDGPFIRATACWGCPIRCGRISRDSDGNVGEGPEYETMWALGPNLGIDDIYFVTKLNHLCNEYGIDTISTGGVLAFAMELTERGIKDYGLSFGKEDGLVEVLEKIAKREDIGRELSIGTQRLAETIGGDAEHFAMNVKGLELPAYDPRGAKGMAVGYATSNRGGCHLHSGYTVSSELFGLPKRVDPLMSTGKATLAAKRQDDSAAEDSLIVCRFAGIAITMSMWSRLLSAVVGKRFTADDLSIIGERIHNLERLINLKLGFSRKDDTLPKRLLQEGEGDRKINLEAMLEEYYSFRGWDENGIPTEDKVRELGLEGLI